MAALKMRNASSPPTTAMRAPSGLHAWDIVSSLCVPLAVLCDACESDQIPLAGTSHTCNSSAAALIFVPSGLQPTDRKMPLPDKVQVARSARESDDQTRTLWSRPPVTSIALLGLHATSLMSPPCAFVFVRGTCVTVGDGHRARMRY